MPAPVAMSGVASGPSDGAAAAGSPARTIARRVVNDDDRTFGRGLHRARRVECVVGLDEREPIEGIAAEDDPTDRRAVVKR